MNKKILFLLIFLSIISIAGFFIFKKTFFHEEVYYGDLELNNISLENDSSKYSISNSRVFKDGEELNHWYDYKTRNQVLKLALFYQWMKEDPILFDPNLDINAFGQTLEKMKQPNDFISKKTGWGNTYPMDFLQGYKDASISYQKFSSDISETNAKELILNEKKAAKDYLSDANRFSDIYKKAIDEGEGSSIIFYLAGDSGVSLQTVYNDYQKMKENGAELIKEVNDRQACLEKSECKRIIEEFKEPQLATMDKDDLFEILSFNELNIDPNQIESEALEVHSKCWKQRDVDYMFSAKNCYLSEGQCLDWSVLSDGEYYSVLGDFNITEREKIYKNIGAKVESQNSSAPYACNDLTYKPMVRTMNYFLQNYKEARLFDEKIVNNGLSSLWEKGKQAEANFFDAKYPSDTAFENLADFYLFAYTFLSKNNLLDYQTRDKFLQRANLIRGKVQQLDINLNRSAFHLEKFKELQVENLDFFQKNKPEYMFLQRTDYSLTFLNFSSFVWKISDQLKYVTDNSNDFDHVSEEKRPILTRDTAIRIFGQEKISDWEEQVRTQMHLIK